MINVNQITSMLAKMPDTALQKYAAMNKNDPYIMALAVSESNRRKEMRAGAQAQQGQMQQPKVADQAVAQMAAPMPEDQGIAQLPAGDMNFADGGIVAFADGGDIPRYQSGGRTSVLAGTEYAIPGMTLPATSFMPQAGKGQEETPWLRRVYNDAQAQGLAYQVEQARARIAAGYGTSADKAILAQAEAAATEKANTPPTEVAANAPAVNRSLLNTAEQRAAPAAGAAATPAAATPAAATPAAAAPGFAGLDVAGMTRKALDEAGKAPNPFAKDVEATGKERVAAAEEYAKGIEAINKQFADIYKGREERLNKREGDISTMKDQHLGLALLQAGAAMMTTPGGIGQAIGKGVDVGSKQYANGIERVRAAQEKLYDARDRLEELNAQRGELSAREQLKAKNEIKNAGIGARQDLIKANMDMYKVNYETALKMVDNQIRLGIVQLEQQGANARAAMPTGEMRAAMMLGTGDTDAAKLESGLKKMQEITADKTGMSVVKLVNETNAKYKDTPGYVPITVESVLADLRNYSAQMYGPKVSENAPTRARPAQ